MKKKSVIISIDNWQLCKRCIYIQLKIMCVFIFWRYEVPVIIEKRVFKRGCMIKSFSHCQQGSKRSRHEFKGYFSINQCTFIADKLHKILVEIEVVIVSTLSYNLANLFYTETRISIHLPISAKHWERRIKGIELENASISSNAQAWFKYTSARLGSPCLFIIDWKCIQVGNNFQISTRL